MPSIIDGGKKSVRRKTRLVRILDKYLFLEAFSLYLIGAFGFLGFLIVNQLFLEGDRLLNPNFPTREILKLVFLNIPYFLTLTIPVAVLFATLMSMGRLAKDNEIYAFFTNGIHLYRLFVPFFILATANVVLEFYVSEAWVPKANAMAEAVYTKYPYLREQETEEADPIIVRLPNGNFLASSFLDKKSGAVFHAVYDNLTSSAEGGGSEAEKGTEESAKPVTANTANGKEREVERSLASAQIRDGDLSVDGRTHPENAVKASGETMLPGEREKDEAVEEFAGSKAQGSPLPSGKVSSSPGTPKDGTADKGSSGKQSVGPRSQADAEKFDEESSDGNKVKLNVSPLSREIYFAMNAQVEGEKLTAGRLYSYEVENDGLVSKREQRSNLQLYLGLPLGNLYSTIRTPEQLSREELQRQTEVKRQIGLNPAKDATDFYLKYSLPFASLFLALVGVPLSLRAPRDERLLGLVFIYILGTGYYFVYFVSKLMGYNEILPPFLAAWMQNIVFFVIGIAIFAFSRK